MKEIISDPTYEATLMKRLDKTRELLQSLLEAFNSLELNTCGSSADLWALINHPDKMYEAGKYAKEVDTEGLSDMQREAYLSKLTFKSPNQVYALAKKCQADPYTSEGAGMWIVKDGEVTLNMREANSLLKARSVFADGAQQEKLASDVLVFQKLYNSINAQTGGALHYVTDLFQPMARAGMEEQPRSINLDAVRRVINAV